MGARTNSIAIFIDEPMAYQDFDAAPICSRVGIHIGTKFLPWHTGNLV